MCSGEYRTGIEGGQHRGQPSFRHPLLAGACLALGLSLVPSMGLASNSQGQMLRGTTDAVTGETAVNAYVAPITHLGDTPPSAPLDLRTGDPVIPVTELGMGFFEGAAYTIRNGFRTLLFRGSHEALGSRDVIFELPDRAPLRRSMMHSVNYQTGLRTGTIAIADSVSSALRGSYATRQTMERANAERARVHGAIANFLPRVSGNFNVSRSRRNTLASGTFDQEVSDIGVEVSVPIFTSGVNLNTFRQAKHVSKAADYTHMAEEHRVALEMVSAHVNLRLNRRIEKTLRQNVGAMERLLDVARRLFDAGDASRTDIAIAQANVQSARSELDIARRSREETEADYESLGGRRAPTSLGFDKPESLIPSSVEEAQELAVFNNPSLQSARHSALASGYEARVARGRFGPQVSGYGRYTRNLYDSLQEDRDDEWEVGVRASVPLIDFTAVPTVDAARHEAVEAEYRAFEQARLVKRQVKRQWSSYQSAKRRVGIVQRQVNAVAASVEGARREYKAGFRSITDVLTDQVKLARARITLETARHEMMIAGYELAFTVAADGVQHIALAH